MNPLNPLNPSLHKVFPFLIILFSYITPFSSTICLSPPSGLSLSSRSDFVHRPLQPAPTSKNDPVPDRDDDVNLTAIKPE
jgi:hypothetical protein